MPKQCQVSNKKYNRASKICFSNKKHTHQQYANLQSKRYWLPEEKRWVNLRVTARVLKTITKYGLKSALKRYGASQDLLYS